MGDSVQWFTDILVGLGRGKSKSLALFLDGLLSEPYDLADWERQWAESGAEFRLADRTQMPIFLAMIRDLAHTDRVASSPIP